MIKVNYTELDGPYGPAMRLEAAGHAGYAPAGQCSGRTPPTVPKRWCTCRGAEN